MASSLFEDNQRQRFTRGYASPVAGRPGSSAEGLKPPTPWICANVGHTSFMLDSLGGFPGDHSSNDPFSSPFHNTLSPFMGVSPLACLPLDGESSFCESPLGGFLFDLPPAQSSACSAPDPISKNHAQTDETISNSMSRSRSAAADIARAVDEQGLQPREPRMRPVITLSLLRSKYHLPISRAAKELGMGVTVMKKYCRKFGINRWPFRKLNSMTKLITSVQQSNPSGKDTLTSLVAERQGIEKDPCRSMRVQTKKLRQSSFKERYKLKHGSLAEPSMEPQEFSLPFGDSSTCRVTPSSPLRACLGQASVA